MERQKHGQFTLNFDPTTGKWEAIDADGHLVDDDADYLALIARLDKRAKAGIKRFDVYRQTQRLTVTSIIRTEGMAIYARGHFACWCKASDSGGVSKERPQYLYLVCPEHDAIIEQLSSLDSRIQELRTKRNDAASGLKSLQDMVSDPACHLPEVEQVRRFLGRLA